MRFSIVFQSNEERKLNQEHMGSTIFGNAIPETISGFAMPQDKQIGRDGLVAWELVVGPN